MLAVSTAGVSGQTLDLYGGYTGLTGTNTSGFFRTEKINGRYWLITPDNNVFWAVSPTTVNYIHNWGQIPLGMDYNVTLLNYMRNNPTGQPGWLTSLHQRFESWGINSLGGFSQDISGTGGRKIPETMRNHFMTSRHQSRGGNMVNSSFPDVFDEPNWTDSANSFASAIAAYKTDPYRIGQFPDNEIRWSQGNQNVATYYFARAATEPGKQYMVNIFLHGRHAGDLAGLNAAWGTSYTSWNGSEPTSLINQTVLPPDDPSYPGRKADKVAFVREVADKYYSTVTTVIRSNDPNHLVCSDRIALWSGAFEPAYDDYNKQIWEVAGQYCDVIAVNSYQDTAYFEAAFGYFGKVFRHAGKPILITEWCRGGNDTPISHKTWALPNQTCRAERAIQVAQETWNLQVPDDPNDGMPAYYIMGMQWFQYDDEPALGRADGENWNAGLVNITDEPYTVLLEPMADLWAQKYDILGSGAPFITLNRPSIVSPRRGQLCDSSTVTLEWDPVSGAAGYDVLLSQVVNFPEDQCIMVRDIAGASYSTGPVLASGTWFWCIRAKSAQGLGGLFSEPETFVVDTRMSGDAEASFGFETLAGWRTHGRGDSGGWGEVLARGDTGLAHGGNASLRLEFTGFSKNRFLEEMNVGPVEASKSESSQTYPGPGSGGTGPITGYPLVFQDDFSTGNAPYWLLPVGTWSVDSQQYRQADMSAWGLRSSAPGRLGDAEYAADVRIVDSSNVTNWAGILINRTHIGHTYTDSGYLICFRRNGSAFIWNTVDKTVYEEANVVADTSVFNRLRVVTQGATVSVYVNDAHWHTWTDPNARFAGGGYFCLITGSTHSRFDNACAYSNEFEVMSFQGQDLVFQWAGGKLDYSHVSEFGFDVQPFRIYLQNRTEAPATKYLRVRMTDEVGGTVIDQLIDPDGQLPVEQWSRVSIPLGDAPRANISRLEFVVNNGAYRFPLEHRVRVNLDNITPPASIGPAQPRTHGFGTDTFMRDHLETWEPTCGEWGLAKGSLHGFCVRSRPALLLASNTEMGLGTFSARIRASSLHATRRAWIVFGANRSTGAFHFAGYDTEADRWEIGQSDGEIATVLASAGEQINPGTYYDLVVRRISEGVRLEVNGQSKVLLTNPGIPAGSFGVGMLYSHISVEHFTANPAPVITEATISDEMLLADNEKEYTAAVTSSDISGAADIRQTCVVLYSGGAWTGANGRGYLAWGQTDDDIIQIGGTWVLMGDATGGGRWGYRTDDWGSDTYITPVSASISVNDNERAVAFTFKAKPVWARVYDQGLRGFARDAMGADSGWAEASARYDVLNIPGDFDLDGDVDQSDFGRFQACYSGAGLPQLDAACANARLDEDNDVDAADFALFRECMSGPETSADPNCL